MGNIFKKEKVEYQNERRKSGVPDFFIYLFWREEREITRIFFCGFFSHNKKWKKKERIRKENEDFCDRKLKRNLREV